MPRARELLLIAAAVAFVATPLAWMIWLALFDPTAGIAVAGKLVPAGAFLPWAR